MQEKEPFDSRLECRVPERGESEESGRNRFDAFDVLSVQNEGPEATFVDAKVDEAKNTALAIDIAVLVLVLIFLSSSFSSPPCHRRRRCYSKQTKYRWCNGTWDSTLGVPNQENLSKCSSKQWRRSSIVLQVIESSLPSLRPSDARPTPSTSSTLRSVALSLFLPVPFRSFPPSRPPPLRPLCQSHRALRPPFRSSAKSQRFREIFFFHLAWKHVGKIRREICLSRRTRPPD